MSKEEEGSQVFKGTTTEDVRLENLGYEQGESTKSPHWSSSDYALHTNIWLNSRTQTFVWATVYDWF
jgi:hypothetical protein